MNDNQNSAQNFAQNFDIEQLEDRLETFCLYIPYVGTCYKTVWFLRIPYPCVKYYRICF